MALCPNCGEENPDRARLCMMCGTALGNGSQPQAEERKVVSILFVDLVGFTARSHAADPEDVRAALGPYHALLKREIERFGGTVEKFIGDAVMAVFGAPVAHEDDAERAVRAALRVTEAMAELNASSALDLSVRAAVNTGEGLVALGARPEAGEGMVTGDVVNTASRLQNVAPVNGVVVGEVTFRSTKHVIDYEELEPETVKGKPDAVTVWRAVSAKSRFGVDADMAAKTPFIGRDYELDLLKGSFRRALRESSIQLVTVVGEPGVGKSRLLTEFFSFIDDQEELIFWRQGRSLPYGEGITFWALGEIVKAQTGISDSDSSDQAADKLKAAVAVVVPEPSERQWFLTRLSPLVGVEVTGGGNPQKEESFTAWRRFLEGIAEGGPLVLVFEDLHWADPSLLEFIEHLVDWVSGVPMFLICTARPELYDKHPDWGGGKRNITIVSLSPLDDSETAQLISSLLSQAVLPAEVHSALLERAGGNPLYAEEFIRMLSDRDILKHKGKAVTLDKDADIPVPESVHALIAARLDTLSRERKALLQDASVAGKVFWSGAVAAVGDTDPESVRQGLHELGAKELVRPSRTTSIEGQQEYGFWHALIRDVSYGQIPRAARAQKHQAMAAWIENSAERLDDHAEVLAHHYSTALELASASGASDVGELERNTRRFLIAAADRALKLDAAKALALYHAALEVTSSDDLDTPRVLRETAKVCRSLGLFEDCNRYMQQAIAGFADRGDAVSEGEASGFLGVFLRDQGRFDEGRQLSLHAAQLLEEHASGRELSLAYMSLASLERSGGSMAEGLAWGNKALEVARGSEDIEVICMALNNRGLQRCELADMGCVEDFREAIDLSEAAGDPLLTFLSFNNLADPIWLIEGPEKGLEANRRAQALGRSHGYVYQTFWARMEALRMLFEVGLWDEALNQADELIAWSGGKNAALVELISTLYRAVILFNRGAMHEALLLEDGFLPLARDTDEHEFLVPCLAFCALLHATTADNETALALIREFEKKTEHMPHYRARYLPDIARALSVVGSARDARRLLVLETDLAFPRDRIDNLTAEALVIEAEGARERALELYDEAAHRWGEYGFVLEEGHALLGAGRCLMALGRKADARFKLHGARRIFSDLGAIALIKETDDHVQKATSFSS
jgi:class 3 adenylate cyclase/tetratricopeptide (TPR) repeat protein